MAKKMIQTGALLGMFAISIVGCSKKDEPVDSRPPLITDLAASYAVSVNTTDQMLNEVSLSFQPEYKTYGSGTTLHSPCDLLLSELLSKAESRLEAQHKELAGDTDQYRDKALDLYRGITDRLESVKKIRSTLVPYCEKDHSKVEGCLEVKGGMKVMINHHMAGRLTVHPVWMPSKNSRYVVDSIIEGKRFFLQSLNAAETNPDSYSALMQKSGTNLLDLDKKSQCLQHLSDPVSEITKLTESSVEQIHEVGSRECPATLRARANTSWEKIKDFCAMNPPPTQLWE